MADSGSPVAPEAGTEFLIDFGRTGNGATYCRMGWSDPETRHTWTLGRESTLEFPRPMLPGDYRLVLEAGPFLWQDRLPVQNLTISVNEEEVGRFAITEVGPVECVVPWRLIERNEWVSVMLWHPDAARPVDVNGVADTREIALAVETLSFVREGADDAESAAGDASNAYSSGALSLDQLMMQFESLGENCEFGLAQRRCHAEPLGLLRFASTPLAALLSALKQRFEGLGDLEQLEIRVSGNNAEYLVFDRRYGILYHPWLSVGEADPKDILQREVKRLPLLKRKLLEDLEEGRKVFVYRGMRPLSRALMLRLVAALREYGPVTLLWVELQDANHPVGTVESVGEGLLKGYIDRFAPGENAHDLSMETWITLCRKAHSMAAEARRHREEPTADA